MSMQALQVYFECYANIKNKCIRRYDELKRRLEH